MPRTKRTATTAANSIDADDGSSLATAATSATLAPSKRSKASKKPANGTVDPLYAALHAIDEPITVGAADSVDSETVAQDQVLAFLVKYPGVSEEEYGTRQKIRELREAVANGTIPESTNDIQLYESLVTTAAYFPLPAASAKWIDPVDGRYVGHKCVVVAELTECMYQPVMYVDRAIIHPESKTYVYPNDDPRKPQTEPYAYRLPASIAPLHVNDYSINSFKAAEEDDPYHEQNQQVLPQDIKGERLSRPDRVFLVPYPLKNRRVGIQTVWKMPANLQPGSIPAPGHIFALSDSEASLFRDSIHPAAMPYVRVVIQPVRGCKYAGKSPSTTKYTYRWSLYLKTDAVEAAVRGKDAAAISAVRQLLVDVVAANHWLDLPPTDTDFQGGQHIYGGKFSVHDKAHPVIFMVQHYENELNLAQTEANMLLELLKREPQPSKSIATQTILSRHRLLRFGDSGKLFFDLFTNDLLHSDAMPTVPTLTPPTSVQCSDIHLRLGHGFESVTLPILALVASYPLERPHPLPLHNRPLVPSRATLVITSRAKIANWEWQARRHLFPTPRSVIVLGEVEDYESLSWRDVQTADVVVASDQFMFGVYDRILLRKAQSRGNCVLDYAWADATLRQYSRAAVLNEWWRQRLRDDLRQRGQDVARAMAGMEGFWQRHTVQGEQESEANGVCIDESVIRQLGSHHILFTEQDEEIAAVRAACFEQHEQLAKDASMDKEVLLHLVHWHRLVLDGVSRATRFQDVLTLADKDKNHRSLLTPLRELSSSSTITISSVAKSPANINQVYSTLSIRPFDSPPWTLPLASRIQLLEKVVVHVSE